MMEGRKTEEFSSKDRDTDSWQCRALADYCQIS